MKKRKILKITAFLIAIAMITGLCVFANGLVGNPLSKMLAENAVEKYMRENYGDTDFVVYDFLFSFKDTSYYAKVNSPTSTDTDFTINIDMWGHIVNDNYENLVLGGYNTARRIDGEYRMMVENVFSSSEFPYFSDIDYGTIEFAEKEIIGMPDVPANAILQDELVIDGIYDVAELAKKAGHLTLYVQDNTVSIEKACEILLKVKQLMDSHNVPFYDIDFVLEYNKDGSHRQEARVETMRFLYSDIYEEGLYERVEHADMNAREYHRMMDEQSKNDIEHPQNIDTP
ncbi:MAG: hypothetical protein E7218_00195 [Anaerofustis stercorihominis]|nr:hypothetical protein [Anaerofustis stercorihominis]